MNGVLQCPEASGMIYAAVARQLGTGHVPVEDAALVAVFLQLLAHGILQAVDLGRVVAPLAVGAPCTPYLTLYVEVGMDEHHNGSAIEEEEDDEAELGSDAKETDEVVERLPEVVLAVGVPHEQPIHGDGDRHFDPAEGGYGEEPGARGEVGPEQSYRCRGCDQQES